jgi:hypothetical protein
MPKNLISLTYLGMPNLGGKKINYSYQSLHELFAPLWLKTQTGKLFRK